ncbi:hypothetical protein D3C72_2300560 [compost metagenome]
MVNSILACPRVFADRVAIVFQCQQGFAFMRVKSERIRFEVLGQYDGVFVGSQIGLPVAGWPTRRFHCIQAVDELHNLLGQNCPKLTRRDHSTHCKAAQ